MTTQTKSRPQVDLASLRHAREVPLLGAQIPRRLQCPAVQHLVRVEVGGGLEQHHEVLPAADETVHIYRVQLDESDEDPSPRSAWAVAIERSGKDIVVVSDAAGERLWSTVCRVQNWECPVAAPESEDPRAWVFPRGGPR